MSRKASVRTLACASGTPAAFSFSKYPGVSNVVVVIERFAFETICRQVPVFRLAGLTPPPEFLAVSAKRLRIRRAEMNFALPGSVALHGRNVLMASCTVLTLVSLDVAVKERRVNHLSREAFPAYKKTSSQTVTYRIQTRRRLSS